MPATLTFSDDFNSLNLWNGSTGTWATNYWYSDPNGNGGSLPSNGEQQWYINSDYAPTASVKPWTVDDGVLTITAAPAPGSGHAAAAAAMAAAAAALVRDGKLDAVPDAGLTFAHVHEVVAAHIAAADKGENGGSYLLGGENRSMLELIQIIERLLGKPVVNIQQYTAQVEDDMFNALYHGCKSKAIALKGGFVKRLKS